MAQKLALCSSYRSYQSFWMSPSGVLLGCHALQLLTGSRCSVPGELTETAVLGVISEAEALVCPNSRCAQVRVGLLPARRLALSAPSPAGQQITERSHFSSSCPCCTPPVRMCVPAYPVRAAFEALFPEHLHKVWFPDQQEKTSALMVG